MAEVESTQVSVRLGEEEMLGVHVLAKLEGIDTDDQRSFEEMLGFTLRRGIVGRFDHAGIEWPPTAAALEQVATLGRVAPVDATGAPGAATLGAVTAGVSRNTRIQLGVLGLALVALVVGLIGGYAFNWSWTGFDSSNQVWDWFGLLLLPVALATVPLWLKFSDYMSSTRQLSLGLAVAVFVAFVAIGYLAPLGWSGFRGQKLWDWLTLLLLPVAVVTVQAWPASGRDVGRLHLAIAAALVIGLTVTVIGGYGSNWTWTGYQGNTLWDWLQLVLAPVALTTVVIPLLARYVSGRAASRADAEKFRRAREAALSEARARAQAQAA